MKFLGLIDIFAAFLLLAIALKADLPTGLAITASIIMVIKGFIGLGFATLIDVGAAIVIILSLFFSIPWWICLIFIILVVQKGIVSLVLL